MSTVKANNVQVGQSGTATNNFTLYQPSTPDGTVRLAVGNSGATTGDVLSVSNTGLSVTGTLSATGNVTLSGGTANGVLYLNASKVATSGSALTFSGTNLTIGSGGKLLYSGVSYGVGIDPDGSGGFGAGYNFETNGGTPRYLVTGPVSGQYISSGSSPFVAWYLGSSAASGTAAPEQMRLTSTGLGIGTSSPKIQEWRAGTYLTVANASTRGQIEIDGAVANSGSASLGALIFTYSTNTTNHKDVALIEASSSGATANQRGGVLNFYTKANGTASPALNMTLDASGNLLVGTTSGQDRIVTKGATSDNSKSVFLAVNSSDTQLCLIRNDGVFYTGVAAASPYNNTTASAANLFVASGGDLFRSTSSLKYKQNVQNAIHGLAELLTLRPVIYEGKAASDAGKTFGGLIAEEVHDAGLTEFVQYAEDGTPDALAYGNMVSLCIKAIQEQQALIESLTSRVAQLEGTQP